MPHFLLILNSGTYQSCCDLPHMSNQLLWCLFTTQLITACVMQRDSHIEYHTDCPSHFHVQSIDQDTFSLRKRALRAAGTTLASDHQRSSTLHDAYCRHETSSRSQLLSSSHRTTLLGNGRQQASKDRCASNRNDPLC